MSQINGDVTDDHRRDANALIGALIVGPISEVDELFFAALNSIIGDLDGQELVDTLAGLVGAATQKNAAFIRFMALQSEGSATALTPTQIFQMLPER